MKETSSAAPGSDAPSVGRRRYDLLLIGVCLLLSLICLFALRLFRVEGAYAAVEIDGKEVGRYSLSNDGEYPLNGGTNILVIRDGECYLSYADCPDKICVKKGGIRYRGQSIICLPNRVSVRVIGEEEGVDIVS